MEWISKSNIMIVGLGLMGGSYARALKRLGYRVSAIDSRAEAIRYALDRGIIDRGFTEPDAAALGDSDAVIFALYPGVFKAWIAQYQHLFKSGALLTDVTGVKSCLVYAIQAMLRPDVEYIAAHPMAGREVYGVENSDERIFLDANYIVVPTARNTPEAIEWCKSLGQVLGFARVVVLSPEEHDEMIGFLSQLTHCIAIALMTCNDSRHLAEYTGNSFRDLTRIARINEDMWSELFLLNKEPLLRHMDAFIGELQALRHCLTDDDAEGLRARMRLSTQRRAAFDEPEE
ncbi:MAG: prephenate dehydrogenase [Ruminococcaceae bacterium]|jgi:prephenate dehydrogenase|nr:prephenate dehydrogenase [Oscillospiraceae bacterium]